jgi:hypothetical protein
MVALGSLTDNWVSALNLAMQGKYLMIWGNYLT